LILSQQSLPVRSPRIKAMANGTMMLGAVEARIFSTSCSGADWFTLTCLICDDLASSPTFWSSESDITLDLQISVDRGRSYVSLIQGKVDTVSIDPILGIIQVEGRDFTASLLASNTQQVFINLTSSEIVLQIAQRHGLTPVVTNTTEIVGNFDTYGRNYITLNQFSKSMTDWDLLAVLASMEQFTVFVSGSTLYFGPLETSAGKVLMVTPADVLELRMERTLPLGSNFQVTIKSWNCWHKQSVVTSVTASSESQSEQKGEDPSQLTSQFVLTRPNLSSADASTLASQQITQIAQHERVVEFEIPGELSLTARDQVMLAGTNSNFDQSYLIESIERRISQQGFVQHIRAKNASQ
jgi:phage protein D